MSGNPKYFSIERLRGSRLKLSLDEPTSFVATGDEVRTATVARVLTLRNARGDPYEIAVARLERPLSYGVHSSDVVSLMTRYAKDGLSDLLAAKRIAVNINLEEEWVLTGEPSDPRMSDASRGFYLGYGIAELQS